MVRPGNAVSRRRLAATILSLSHRVPQDINWLVYKSINMGSDDLETFRALVRAGASPDSVVNGAPLWVHVLRSPEHIRTIFEAGGGRRRTGEGKTPIMYATSSFGFSSLDEAKTVLGELCRQGDIEARDLEGRTALMLATMAGLGDMVTLLLRNGAKLEARDPMGRTAFLLAAAENLIEVGQILAAAGADVSAQDDAGMNALMLAARYRRRRVFRALLRSGVDVDAKNIHGQRVDDLLWFDGELRRLVEEEREKRAKPQQGKTKKSGARMRK